MKIHFTVNSIILGPFVDKMPINTCQKCGAGYRPYKKSLFCPKCRIGQPRPIKQSLLSMPVEILRVIASCLPLFALSCLIKTGAKFNNMLDLEYLSNTFQIGKIDRECVFRCLRVEHRSSFWKMQNIQGNKLDLKIQNRSVSVFNDVMTRYNFMSKEVSPMFSTIRFRVVKYLTPLITFGIQEFSTPEDTSPKKFKTIQLQCLHKIPQTSGQPHVYALGVKIAESDGITITEGTVKWDQEVLQGENFEGEVLTVMCSYKHNTVNLYIGKHFLHSFAHDFKKQEFTWQYCLEADARRCAFEVL